MDLTVHEVIAKNYGADHANRIHSDDGAARYGFAGALVPGVGLYAYLTRPVLETLGMEWLERGAMGAKFIHPVYDGESVYLESRITGTGAIGLRLELFNRSGTLCATGTAGIPSSLERFGPEDYPPRPLPASDKLPQATIDNFRAGDHLGSLEFTLDWAGRMAKFLDDVVETSPVYRGSGAICHPAFWIAQANEIVMQNMALGPWIHTASEAQHYSVARDGDRLSLRGRVIDSFERRGNEYIALELGLFGEEGRPIAKIKHTAIIKLREPEKDEQPE
jgi:acyl dehydratase